MNLDTRGPAVASYETPIRTHLDTHVSTSGWSETWESNELIPVFCI
jgi:hypothetical protein